MDSQTNMCTWKVKNEAQSPTMYWQLHCCLLTSHILHVFRPKTFWIAKFDISSTLICRWLIIQQSCFKFAIWSFHKWTHLRHKCYWETYQSFSWNERAICDSEPEATICWNLQNGMTFQMQNRPTMNIFRWGLIWSEMSFISHEKLRVSCRADFTNALPSPASNWDNLKNIKPSNTVASMNKRETKLILLQGAVADEFPVLLKNKPSYFSFKWFNFDSNLWSVLYDDYDTVWKTLIFLFGTPQK